MKGSKGTPYARAFMPWVVFWYKAGLSSLQISMMLLFVSRMEINDRGEWTTVYPRAEMAEALGVKPETIKRNVTELKKKGIVENVGMAFNGRAQRYRIMNDLRGVTYAPHEGGHKMTPPKPEGGYESCTFGGYDSYPEEGDNSCPPLRSKKEIRADPYWRRVCPTV